MNEEYIVWLDMDGVLVGFQDGYAQISKGMSYESKYGKVAAIRHFLRHGTDFWSKLGWERGGRAVYDTVKELFKTVRILSSSGSEGREEQHQTITKGKRLWLQINIPELTDADIVIVRHSSHKQEYASRNGILIDDLPSNIKEWNQAGGTGILHNSKHYQKTIETLEDLSRPLNLTEILKHVNH